MNTEALDVVRETLTASLPPGSPLMFKEIVSVSATGKGKARKIIAGMVMFDDLTGVVKLEPFQWGWSIQWISLEGGAISLENGQWLRVKEDEAA